MDYKEFENKKKNLEARRSKIISKITKNTFERDLIKRLEIQDELLAELNDVNCETLIFLNHLYREVNNYESKLSELR